MNNKIIMVLPLAFALVLSPISATAGGTGIGVQDAEKTQQNEKPAEEGQDQQKPDENTNSGTAAGQEAERIARRVSSSGFFSTPGLVGAAIIGATLAVALQAATDVVEGAIDTSTTTGTTATSTSTSTATSTGTGN